MKTQLFLFTFLFTFNTAVHACGTPENWMDAYQGVESRNDWRDSMNRLEALVMLSGCGASHLDKQQQLRLSGILVESLEQEAELRRLPSSHYEIADKLRLVRSPVTFDAMIETIYRRFDCLSKAPEASLREHFGTRFCPGGESVVMRINAPSGGLVRARPEGRKIASFKNSTEVRVLGKSGEWYRVALPKNTYIPGEPSIAYVHESILGMPENLFECRTDLIEGSDASAFLVIDNSGKASLDWFDQKSTKLMSCHLSIVEGKYSARAHTNDITFEFEKDRCESVQKDIDSHLDVLNEGFLKIMTGSTGGYISHLLMFYNAQPIACDIEKIDRKKLEQMAGSMSQY